jgi:hypothetical protein
MEGGKETVRGEGVDTCLIFLVLHTTYNVGTTSVTFIRIRHLIINP